MEADQGEGPAQEHNRPRRGRVDHAQHAERHAREEAPVGPREHLEVLGSPERIELRARHGHVRALAARHGSARHGSRLWLLDQAHTSARLAPAGEPATRVPRRHRGKGTRHDDQ